MPLIYDTLQKVQQTTWWAKFANVLTYVMLAAGFLTLILVMTFSIGEVLFG